MAQVANSIVTVESIRRGALFTNVFPLTSNDAAANAVLGTIVEGYDASGNWGRWIYSKAGAGITITSAARVPLMVQAGAGNTLTLRHTLVAAQGTAVGDVMICAYAEGTTVGNTEYFWARIAGYSDKTAVNGVALAAGDGLVSAAAANVGTVGKLAAASVVAIPSGVALAASTSSDTLVIAELNCKYYAV